MTAHTRQAEAVRKRGNRVAPADYAPSRHGIAASDADEFHKQYPTFRSRYGDFVSAMVYGERPEFDGAIGTVVTLAKNMIQQQGNGTC